MKWNLFKDVLSVLLEDLYNYLFTKRCKSWEVTKELRTYYFEFEEWTWMLRDVQHRVYK